ncbi:MAG: glycosyl transferase, group 1 [Phenylobacterium sp.]|nr:glycosyl transferase, group 1 [Phenylobacterium sp.]
MSGGVLFVHNNFPAQFRDLATTLVARGVPCTAIGGETAAGWPGVELVRYRLARGSGQDVFNLAIRAEADLLRARAALNAARWLKEQGRTPQLIVGHPGWGETALLSHIFPEAKQALFSEFYYHSRNSDIDFDPEFWNGDEESLIRGKAKNAVMAMSLAEADAIVAPTEFQASRLPPAFRARTRVIHEGVDTDAITPGPAAPFPLEDGRVLAAGAPVITHINNQMEPLRGLHIFARALPRLLDAVPDAQVLIIGTAKPRGYGLTAPDGRTWKQAIFEPLADRLDAGPLADRLDAGRIHFLGRVDHARMLAALRLSTAHVYYSYPFVLSWSVVEAMASGCYVIGSDTPPVRDAIEDGVNGRLLPFFDVDALAEALIAACRNPRPPRPCG